MKGFGAHEIQMGWGHLLVSEFIFDILRQYGSYVGSVAIDLSRFAF